MAQKLRIIRNYGAHGGTADLTAAEVPVVQSVLRAIVEYIYLAPELLRDAERTANRLEAKEKRSAKAKSRKST